MSTPRGAVRFRAKVTADIPDYHTFPEEAARIARAFSCNSASRYEPSRSRTGLVRMPATVMPRRPISRRDAAGDAGYRDRVRTIPNRGP